MKLSRKTIAIPLSAICTNRAKMANRPSIAITNNLQVTNVVEAKVFIPKSSQDPCLKIFNNNGNQLFSKQLENGFSVQEIVFPVNSDLNQIEFRLLINGLVVITERATLPPSET